MPRRKRVEEEEVDETQQKKQKSPETRRSTRNVSREQPLSPTNDTNGIATRGKAAKTVKTEEPIAISDSSDLSDPPSEITSPAPPAPVKSVTKGKKPVTKNSSQVKKPTSKEHEEALNLFIRDDSDDELSDTPSDSKPIEGVTEQSSDSDEEDWEDVDLSHRKHVSLDDLNETEVPAGLEVTLERTQQSMRIKCSVQLTLDLIIGIKHQARLSGKSDCILIYFTFNVCFITARSGINGLMTQSYRYQSPENVLITARIALTST